MDFHTTYRDELPRRMQGFQSPYLDPFISTLDPDREGVWRMKTRKEHTGLPRGFKPRTQAYKDSEEHCLVQTEYFDGHLAPDHALPNLPDWGMHKRSR
jgi:hypothetical protein